MCINTYKTKEKTFYDANNNYKMTIIKQLKDRLNHLQLVWMLIIYLLF